MRILKIVGGIVVAFLLLATGLVLYIQNIDWNARRPQLENEVSAVLGREFRISGDVIFTLFPRPNVDAGGLSLANAEWGSEPLMLQAERVSFDLAPLSLLLLDPHTTRLSMEGVRLLLEEAGSGEKNWHFGDSGSVGGGLRDVFPTLKSVAAEDLNVIYRRPGEAPMRLKVDTFQGKGRPLGRGFKVDVRGQVNDRPASIAAEMSPLHRFMVGGNLAGRIEVESAGGKLTLDGDFGRPPKLEGVDIGISGEGDDVPAVGALANLPEDMRGTWKADLRFSGQKQGYRISDADLTLGDYQFAGDLAHDQDEGYSGKVDIRAPDYELHLDGAFGPLTGLSGIDATIRGQGTDMPSVAALASLPEHLRKDWNADLHLKGDGDRLELTDMKLKVAESDLAGTVTVDRSGTRPRVEGQLKSEYVDIAFLRRGEASRAVKEKEVRDVDGRVLNDEPIPLEWMRAVDASLEIDAKRLQATLFVYTDTLAKITLDNGVFRVSAERGTIYGADTSADLQFDSSADPAKLSVRVLARGADVGKIMSDWSDPPFMTGSGDFDLQLDGYGDSPAALMGSMSGQARVIIGEGQAQVGVLERMVRTVGIKTLGSLLGQDQVDVVPMNCFAANLVAENGVVKANVLVLDSKEVTVFGSGDVNLAKEELNLLLKPKPKIVTLTTAVPIRVGGTLQNPSLSAEPVGTLRKLAGIASLFIFPPAAVAGLVDFGAGDNQCVKLATEVQKKK